MQRSKKSLTPAKIRERASPKNKLYDKAAKHFWLCIPILASLYYYYSSVSTGFYQDDEIAQYINMLEFWRDPSLILGNGPKPGYKILTVIPAAFGYQYVLFLNAIIAACTVYLTYVLIKNFKLGNVFAVTGGLLLAVQPLFIELSFRSYSEIFTALCITGVLILYRREKYFLSGLLCGYMFTVRQEIALFILILAFVFGKKKNYAAALSLFIFPLFYNFLGYLKTGNMLFVLSEMKNVSSIAYNTQGPLHYFKVYIFIVGPVVMTLFLMGFFGYLFNRQNSRKYLSEYVLFYIIFVSVFLTQILTTLNNGPNPGNWRYLLHISPVCSFFAVLGLRNLTDTRLRKISYTIAGTFAIIVLLFLSKATDGFILLEKQDYTKFIFIIIFFAFTFFLSRNIENDYRLAAIALVLSFVYFFYSNEPKRLSPENITTKETAEFVDNIEGGASREKLVNHTLVRFYAKTFKSKQESFKQLNSENLKSTPRGTLIIWESHYGYRPEFSNDVKLETLQNETSFKLLKQFISSDRRFASYVFEKI